MKRLVLLLLGFAALLSAQPALVTVSQILYKADGTPYRGSVFISWQQFDTGAGQHIPAGTKQVNLTPTGLLSVNLVPNVGAVPAGTAYTVTYKLDLGASRQVAWIVPASGPVTVTAIESTTLVGPSSIVALTQLGSGGASNGQCPVWNAASGTWVPTACAGGGSAAIGGAITSGTAGSILFVSPSGFFAQDNANFFYSPTQKCLAIGANSCTGNVIVLQGQSGAAAQATFLSSGAQQASFSFWTNNLGRFQLGAQANGDIFLYDATNARNFIDETASSGKLTLQAGGGPFAIGTLGGSGARCVHTDNAGNITVSGIDCIAAITNDTNVTGSISGSTLTLGWAGTLAAARLNGNVVQAITNDTNINGSIAAQNLTLSWAGTLAAARMVNAGVHTGDSTSTFPAVTISAGAITLAKMANLAANSIIGNNTGSPATPLALTTAQTKTLLAIACGDLTNAAASCATDTTSATNITGGTLAAARLPNAGVFTGDATSTFPALTIGAGAITLAKMANLAANSTICNNTGAGATPIACSVAQMQALLSVPTGTGTGVFTGQSNAYTTGTQDFSSAAHTLPEKVGTIAGKPATCTIGEKYFATDATAGQNDFDCTATNTWTQQLNSGAGGSVNSFSGDGALLNNSASTGAVTATLANAAAHKYWGNPTGISAAPGYNSIVAADLPATTVNAITNDTNIQGSISAQNLTLSWAGTLAAVRMVNAGVHTGDSTSTFPAVTISAGAITLAKMASLAANSFICNNTGAGATPIACTIAQAKTLLAIACADLTNAAASCATDATNATNIGSGTLAAARLPSAGVHSGDAAGTFPTVTINAAAITLAKMANLAANSIICNNTGAGATPIACTQAQIATMLAGQTLFTLTTTGTSGPASYSGGTLNIPQYTGGGGNTYTSVATSTTPTFTRSSANQEWAFTISTSNSTGTTSGLTSGDILIFNITQCATAGGCTFTWPTGFSEACTIAAGNALTGIANLGIKQTFYWDGSAAHATTPCVTTASPSDLVLTDTANTFTAAGTLDMSASTVANAARVPVVAGATATANGAIDYDSTNNMLHAAQTGADAMIPQFTATPANNDCAKWVVSGSNYKLGTAGAACGAGGGSGGGVNAQTTNYTLIAGDAGKLVTFNGSSLTATLLGAPGSTYAVGIKNLNASDLIVSRNGLQINGGTTNITLKQGQSTTCFADSTPNYWCDTPTAPVIGWVSNVTGQSTSQGTVTLATSPAAGMYRVNYYADQSATCTSGSNSVFFTFNWTDGTNARSFSTGSLALGTNQSTTSGGLSGLVPLYVGSSNVTYTSTVTGTCATGISTYDIHAALERMQ